MDADRSQFVLARQHEGQRAFLDQGQPFAIGVVDGIHRLDPRQLLLDFLGQGAGLDLPDIDGLFGVDAAEIEFGIHDDPLTCG